MLTGAITNNASSGAGSPIITHIQATGAINGTNKVFTAPNFITGVFINGLQQMETLHFTLDSSTSFTLGDAPVSGDIVTVTTLY